MPSLWYFIVLDLEKQLTPTAQANDAESTEFFEFFRCSRDCCFREKAQKIQHL